MALFKEHYGPFRLKGLPARSTGLINSVIPDVTFCKCLTYGKDSSALQCIMLNLPLSDLVFLPIVRTIWASLARILHQKTMYSCVLSCWRLRQGARHITGFGQ